MNQQSIRNNRFAVAFSVLSLFAAEPILAAAEKSPKRVTNARTAPTAGQGQDSAEAQAAHAVQKAEQYAHPALKEDPSLTNEKDVFPNGYAHRPAKSKEEKLAVFGRVMFRGISGEADSPWSRGSDFGNPDFNFRRLRLGAMYQGSNYWGAIVHLRLENAMNSGPGNQPNRGLIQEAYLWYNWDWMRLKISAGMVNVPFTREYIVSSANLVNIERGMVVDALQQFDNGILVNFNPLREIDKNLDRYMTVYGMVGTGGGGAGDFSDGRRVDTFAPINGTAKTAQAYSPVSPFFYGRININPLGAMKRGNKEVGWVEGEEMFLTENKISFGAAFAGTNETRITNNMRVEYQAQAPTSAPFAGAATASPLMQVAMPLTLSTNTNGKSGATNAGTGQCDAGVQCSLFGQTYDVKGQLFGFYFDAAYTYLGGAAGQNITGITATLGRNFHITNGTWIMPVIRYDFMKGNFGNVTGHYNTSGLSSDPANQLTWLWVGVNLFVDKNLSKIQIAYAKSLNAYQGYDAAGGALAAYKQDMVIVQGTVSFWTGAQVADLPNTDLSGHRP